jgi:Family of unknown function (DUF5681)
VVKRSCNLQEKMLMSDYKVGYKSPPKHTQIKPGECRNPNGRRGKRPKVVLDNTEASILERLDAETINVGGLKMTKREVELRRLCNMALAGNVRASQLLDKKRAAAGLNKPIERGGVLVVPAPIDFDDWGIRAARQQAKHRVRNTDDVEAVDQHMKNIGKTNKPD